TVGDICIMRRSAGTRINPPPAPTTIPYAPENSPMSKITNPSMMNTTFPIMLIACTSNIHESYLITSILSVFMSRTADNIRPTQSNALCYAAIPLLQTPLNDFLKRRQRRKCPHLFPSGQSYVKRCAQHLHHHRHGRCLECRI